MNKKLILSVALLGSLSLVSCQKTPTPTDILATDEKNFIQNVDTPFISKEIAKSTVDNIQFLQDVSNKEIQVLLGTNRNITLQAVVNTENVTAVSSYEYQQVPMTEELRENLFQHFFGEKTSEMVYDSRNNLWELYLSEAIGNFFQYETFYPTAGETVTGEESFMLQYRDVNLYPFEDNLLDSVSSSSLPLVDCLQICNEALASISDVDYIPDYIHAYGTNGRHPYFKIVYKPVIDGTILTSFNDISFYVDKNGIQKMTGSLYETVPTSEEKEIISLEQALESLEKNQFLFSNQEDTLTIGEITFEYVVVNTLEEVPEIVPVWRFLIGENEDEINRNKTKILAINAWTSDLIFSERGVSF